ncbi:MAG TPA: hypothetical protein VNO31_15510, partial [Umezawaea sp.]|nr:hypothetical protein [Umezawaea sp.]
TVLDRSPLTVAPRHRSRYAAVVRRVVAVPAQDPVVLRHATLPLWATWDADFTPLLVDLASDVGNTATWLSSATALLEVSGVAGDVEPVRTTVARLLAAGDPFDAEADRDLPARQRIGAVARMVVDGRRSPVMREAAKALSEDLSGVPEHRGSAVALAVAAVPWDDDPLAQLHEVARLADRPVLAERARAELAGQVDAAVRLLPRERVREIAEALAVGGPGAAGLALAITSVAGPDTGWPEHWRELLRALRRHEDPDVRLAALDTVTARE